MTNKLKNYILISFFFLGQLPSLFFGTDVRLQLGFFTEKTSRLDFFTMYYTNAFSFLILTYLLHYPKGLDKQLTRMILIICYLDFMHLLFFAKQGFGMAKIGVAILIFYVLKWIKLKK
tara:strand:+ start:383 stop:736 length:354 start_codon:yes stop_codon:yes gene_type:complete